VFAGDGKRIITGLEGNAEARIEVEARVRFWCLERRNP